MSRPIAITHPCPGLNHLSASVGYNERASRCLNTCFMVLGAAGLGGTPASARRRGVVAGARVPPLSPWSRRAARPNTVNVDSAHHLTGTPRGQ